MSLFCFFAVASSLLATESRGGGLIAAGTRWETAWHVVEGKEPGPTLVLTGGVHGDEPAGSRAAEQIRHWKIAKGRLVVVPRVNAPALEARSRLMPGVEDGLRDLNRNFPRAGTEEKARGELAVALWDFIGGQKPDWVVDLHEGFGVRGRQSKSVGSSIIDANGAADAVVPGMLAAVNASISGTDRHFVNLSPPADGSLARAAAEHLGVAAMILETTSRDQELSLRTRQHRLMVAELLAWLGMISPEDKAGIVTPETGVLRVAVFDGKGVGDAGPGQIEATLRAVPEALVWRVGSADIREGALRHFDLVVFPGGSGGSQAKDLGEQGRGEVKRFVENGGGYVGICAGAYLAAVNYPWSLAISDHRTFAEMREIPGEGQKSMWYRGPSAMVKMELTQTGREILGGGPGELDVRYHNGPIVSPAGIEALPDYEVLAWFRSEVSRYEPQKGTMAGSPAMVSGRFGKGRVLCISPHPEASWSLRPLVAKGMIWAAGTGE